MFNLQDFMSKNKDFARGYTFYIIVNGGHVTEQDQRYLVRSSSLPTTTNPAATVNWQGNAYKIGTTQEFSDFTVTYSSDIFDRLRNQYLTWSRKIHDPQTNLHGHPEAYMVDIDLEHLSHFDGNVIMKYKLVGAWPSQVGELALDYGNKDVAQFSVTFTYQYHYIV